MFTVPSLGKLIVLVVILLAVWYGLKLIGRLDREREELARRHGADKPASRARSGPPAEEMVRCRNCGTYMPASGSGSCGKAGCPF